jgi:hypothetical protein
MKKILSDLYSPVDLADRNLGEMVLLEYSYSKEMQAGNL